MNDSGSVSEKVLAFYEKLPFNSMSTPEAAAAEIRNNNMLWHYFKGKEKIFFLYLCRMFAEKIHSGLQENKLVAGLHEEIQRFKDISPIPHAPVHA